MLESIRSRSSGIFAWFVAIVIIVTMALFGVSSYVSDGVDPLLFEHGDEKVLQSHYINALDRAQRRAISQDSSIDVSSDVFKENVLKQLLNQALVTSLSKEAGYAVADETIAKLIIENSAFQVDGKFDQETYDRFVAGSFGSKQRYESLLKKNLVSNQVASGLVDSAIESTTLNNDCRDTDVQIVRLTWV